jgi:hypothetical protein
MTLGDLSRDCMHIIYLNLKPKAKEGCNFSKNNTTLYIYFHDVAF